MDDFERAVLLLFDPTLGSDQERALAEEQCSALGQSAEGVSFCMERFLATSEHKVKFWCLRMVEDSLRQRWDQMSAREREAVQQWLLHWMCEGVRPDELSFVRNKWAAVLVEVARRSYPGAWPSFFQDLLTAVQTVGSVAVVDLFLRVLLTIDSEVISLEFNRTSEESKAATLMKDTMRDTCVGEIVELWYSILTVFAETQPRLVSKCLVVIGKYITWIDIGLIANERVLAPIFGFLQVEGLQEDACECLLSIVGKKMDAANRLGLIQRMQLVDALCGLCEVPQSDDFLTFVSSLVSGVGELLCSCWGELAKLGDASGCVQLVLQLVPHMCTLLESADMDVSRPATAFAGAYVQHVKKSAEPAVHAPHLERLVHVIAVRISYPDGYDFESEGETEAEFQEYRRLLTGLLRNITRIMPADVLGFTHSRLTAVFAQPLEAMSAEDVESAMCLFHAIGEGLSEESFSSEGFQRCIEAVLASNVSSLTHKAVSLTYFELLLRYSRFLHRYGSHLVGVLGSLLDERGMRHGNATVRSRSCYLFLKLVKSLRGILVPMLDAILNELQPMLTMPLATPSSSASSPSRRRGGSPGGGGGGGGGGEGNMLTAEERFYIFDAAGSLLSLPEIAAADRARYFDAIQAALIHAAADALAADYGGNLHRRAMVEKWCGHVMCALGNLFKTTTAAQGAQEPLRSVLLKGLDFVMRAFSEARATQRTRLKAYYFLNRVVTALGPALCEHLIDFLPRAVHMGGLKEYQDMLLFLEQIMAKQKAAAFPLIDAMLVPLADRLVVLLADPSHGQVDSPVAGAAAGVGGVGAGAPTSPMLRPRAPSFSRHSAAAEASLVSEVGGQFVFSEETRERHDLLKSYLTFISAVAVHHIGAFVCEQNLPRFGEVLNTVATGAVEHPDPGALKTCIIIMDRFASAWGTNVPQFQEWLRDVMVPTSFHVLMMPHFLPADAQFFAVLREVASLHLRLVKMLGADFLSFLEVECLPAMQTPPDMIAGYLTVLHSQDLKSVRNFLRDMALAAKA